MAAPVDRTVDEITAVVEGVFTAWDDGGEGAVDALLAEALAGVGELHSEDAGAMLRTAYILREDLPSWPLLRDAAVAVARGRYGDEWVEDAFTGLLEEDHG